MQKAIVLIASILLTFTSAFSQCAMCKAVVESQDGVGAGINQGIVYLMFIPYVAFGVVGFLIYRHYKQNQQKEAAGNE